MTLKFNLIGSKSQNFPRASSQIVFINQIHKIKSAHQLHKGPTFVICSEPHEFSWQAWVHFYMVVLIVHVLSVLNNKSH